MYNDGYPVAKFNQFDNSGAGTDTLFLASDGLNVPFVVVMAERGTPGALTFGGSAQLNPVLGSETFNPASPYFSMATYFAGQAMARQGVVAMRLVDPDAKTSTLGLFAEVTPKLVTQYQKDSNGARLIDADGDWIPVEDPDAPGEDLKEAGVAIKWVVRELTAQETAGALLKVSRQDAGVTTQVYPFVDLEVSSPGKYGNRQGLSLSSTRQEQATIAEDIGSVLYRLVPRELPTAVSTTASVITDSFGSPSNDFSFKDQAIYSGTQTNYALKYILGNSYTDADTGANKLPYTLNGYGAYVREIGEAVLAVSPELGAIDPYLIDLISGTDLEGNHYDHVEIDASAVNIVNSNVVLYAKGGTDGDTSFTKLQELFRDWIEGADHGEFGNMLQWPITHFTDPGFTMETKLTLFNMLDLRDNLKIDVSTQDALLPPNTKAQDMSAAQTLLFRAQLHPNSVINGVGCSRVSIFAHCGDLVNGNPYIGKVPYTLNRLVQRGNLDGATYLRGSAGGLPNSEITLFRNANWYGDADEQRKLAWGTGLNVAVHASRTQIFYPSLRTVYPNDTSLLSDDEFADRIVYLYKICREVWATYAGVRNPPEQLYGRIQKTMDDRCTFAFGGDSIQISVQIFQTALDANLGYAISANVVVSGPMPMRQMNFNIILQRVAPEAA